MAVKRISELDLFDSTDISNFLSSTPEKDSYNNDYDPAKLSVGLFLEVSTTLSGLSCDQSGNWDIIPVNEGTSYFISKKIPANLFGQIILNHLDETILSGPVYYVGSQNFGEPISSAFDGHDYYWYDNRSTIVTESGNYPNRLCVMISSDFTNTVTFHPPVYFHSGIIAETDHVIALSTGTVTTYWGDRNITVQDFARTFDLIVDGTAYLSNAVINNLSVTNEIHGTVLSARWADIAETYESDNCYAPGTLVEFGGEKEITIARNSVNAVVTSRPGIHLNSGKTNGLGIALVGRVPVRVIGKIKKFDKVGLSDIPGVGIKVDPSEEHIGIALESSDKENEKLVECIVQMKI